MLQGAGASAGSGHYMIRGRIRFYILLLACMAVIQPLQAQNKLQVRLAILSMDEEPHLPLSLIDLPIEDPAVPGALMAVEENNRTGMFTNQEYLFENFLVSDQRSAVDVSRELANSGIQIVIADLPMEPLLELSDVMGESALIFNVRAGEVELRNQQCRANILHTALSRAMKTDALVQYLVWKRWNKWMVIVGKFQADKAYYSALERSAHKFNGDIVEVKEWTFDAGSRRTDSGHVLAQQEVPLRTRGKDHQVLIVADEADEFGEYLPYRTDLPRLVAGTQGLTATSWHRSHEQWGGTQLQRRFEKFSGRDMQPRDYAAWMAVRAVGEAATRLNTADHEQIRGYLLGEEFRLAAFKGVPLSFRNWNGQLRQPVLVVGPRMLVSVSPQKKFLHEFSSLDTLGYDRPESSCTVFSQPGE